MTISIADLAKTAENIVEGVIEHEGLINTIAGAVGILPQVALAEKALPLLAGVLKFMQQETGKDLIDVFGDLLGHLTPGKPNSPVLTDGGPPDTQSPQG